MMTFKDLKIKTLAIVCTANSSNKELFSCVFTEPDNIKREINNISILNLDVDFASLMSYKLVSPESINIDNTISKLKFGMPTICHILGIPGNITINCFDSF